MATAVSLIKCSSIGGGCSASNDSISRRGRGCRNRVTASMNTKATKRRAAIPKSLAPHFQEFSLRKLNVQRDALVIMQRVLEYGDLAELRWLFETYGRSAINEFVRQRGESWLSRRAFYFWRRYFKLKSWKRAPNRHLREQLWPF